MAQTGTVPFLSVGTKALPSRPQTSFCFFPLYSEPAPSPWSRGAEPGTAMGEGRGALRKDEAWSGAGGLQHGGEGRGGEDCSFL